MEVEFVRPVAVGLATTVPDGVTVTRLPPFPTETNGLADGVEIPEKVVEVGVAVATMSMSIRFLNLWVQKRRWEYLKLLKRISRKRWTRFLVEPCEPHGWRTLPQQSTQQKCFGYAFRRGYIQIKERELLSNKKKKRIGRMTRNGWMRYGKEVVCAPEKDSDLFKL